jgi:eukaryotic-like serine/threonine-protein kinase
VRTPQFSALNSPPTEGSTSKLRRIPLEGMGSATQDARTPLPPHFERGFPRVRGYDILGLVGRGGMGLVFEARHRELNRRVALKTLRGDALADPVYRERFRHEAEAIAQLQHPNIIQVFEVGTTEPSFGATEGEPFIALEFVDGGSLAQRAKGPQRPEFAARVLEPVARAAHAAHRLGIVHRDLKPANVLLARDGTPKVADFGIAKQMGAEARSVTRVGTVMGTPEYMAPEQFEGETAVPSIDVYALGVMLYELLTGRVPLQGATFADTMLLAIQQEPVPPSRLQPGVPRDLETICLKCLEKDPRKRYRTANDLADDLARWQAGEPILARPLGPVGRAVRWARRKPTVAALVAAVVLVSAAGAGVGVL